MTVRASAAVDHAALGLGYHTATCAGEGTAKRLIVSPGSCHVDPELHTWGWAVQLYATRSTDSWGFGDFRDLRRLNEWSSRHGSSMVLINPLHAPSPGAATPIDPKEISAALTVLLPNVSADKICSPFLVMTFVSPVKEISS